MLKNLALFLVTIAVSLLMAEGTLRLAGYSPRTLTPNRFFVDGTASTWSVPEQTLGWMNRQGVSVSIEEGAVPMTFWSHGRRASRRDPARPEDGIPVMIVGGSNAQSYGVRDEESFPYLLHEQFSDLWIENFGNGGYGTVQTLMLTERMLEDFYGDKSPALFIVTFADSHVARNVSDQSWVYSISDSQGRYVAPPHYRLRGEELTFQPFETIGLWPLEDRSALVTTLHHIWLQSFAYATAEQGRVVTRRVFDRFAALVNAKGGTFVIAVLEDYSQTASDLFAQADFAVVDCSGYERTAPQDYLLGGGSHPNAKYHAHFATCIGAWLETHMVSRERSAGYD